MKHLFVILLSLTVTIGYSQLPTRLKLKQLEVGPPNAAVLTDSTGQVTFGAAESGGGNAGPGGIYEGSNTIPIATLATVTESDGSVADFAIGNFPNWPYVSRGVDDHGFYYARNYWGGVGMCSGAAIIDIFPDQVTISSRYNIGGNSSEIWLDNTGVTLSAFNPFNVKSQLKLIPVSATLFRADLIGGTTVSIFVGNGTPEGVVTANVGSTYHRTDGGAGTSFYVKQSGTGNTGWVGK